MAIETCARKDHMDLVPQRSRGDTEREPRRQPFHAGRGFRVQDVSPFYRSVEDARLFGDQRVQSLLVGNPPLLSPSFRNISLSS